MLLHPIVQTALRGTTSEPEPSERGEFGDRREVELGEFKGGERLSLSVAVHIMCVSNLIFFLV